MTNDVLSLRPELTALPSRMTALPIDRRGYPVPWFVTWIDGAPEFRATDATKFQQALLERRCWVCGDYLGVYKTFVLGPMCTVTRTTSEPACHLECAEWSARNCPFLVRPHMVRREDEFTRTCDMRGRMVLRNPGVTALWTTRSFSLFHDENRRVLITVGDPSRPVAWYCAARAATRDEVLGSIRSGLPALEATCETEATADARAAARAALTASLAAAQLYLPAV